MYKLIINPLMVLAAQELSFLNALPEPAHDLKWTSPQRNQINAMFYKFLGTNPKALDILKIAKQQRWPSGEMKGTTDAQRAILDMLCVVNSRQMPEAIDLFETLIGGGPLWVALLPHCYYVVGEDNRQVNIDQTFDETYKEAPAKITNFLDETPMSAVDNLQDIILNAWGTTLQAHAGHKLTNGDGVAIEHFLRTHWKTLGEAKEMCNYAFSELGFFDADAWPDSIKDSPEVDSTTTEAPHLEQQYKDAWLRAGNTITEQWPAVYKIMQPLVQGHTFTNMIDFNNLLDNAVFIATEQLRNQAVS